jgi:hypothetical protein
MQSYYVVFAALLAMHIAGCQTVVQGAIDSAIDSRNAENNRKTLEGQELRKKELLDKAKAGDVASENELGEFIIYTAKTPAEREVGFEHLRSAGRHGHKNAAIKATKYFYQTCKEKHSPKVVELCANEFSTLVDLAGKFCGRGVSGGASQTLPSMVSQEQSSRGNSYLAQVWKLVNSDRCLRPGESYKTPKLTYSPSWNLDTTAAYALYNVLEKDPAVAQLMPPSVVVQIEQRIAALRQEAAQKGYQPMKDE